MIHVYLKFLNKQRGHTEWNFSQEPGSLVGSQVSIMRGQGDSMQFITYGGLICLKSVIHTNTFTHYIILAGVDFVVEMSYILMA